MSLASRQQPSSYQEADLRSDYWRSETADALRRLCAQATTGQDVALTIPVAAPASAEALLELDEQALYWLDRDGVLYVGLGAARSFVLKGAAAPPSGRPGLTRLDHAADAQLPSCVCGGALGAPAERVRCFGGLAFQPGRAQQDPWQAFGDGSFQVPRLTLTPRDGQWLLSLFIRNDEFSVAEAHLDHALTLASQWPSRNPHPGTEAPEAIVSGTDDRRFTGLVQDILNHIKEGDCTKIVAALRVELLFPRPLSVAATLTELRKAGPATVFAFKRGPFTFCGATPERLVKKEQLTISTEALAGTFQRADKDYARELLRSPKEHEEHQPVLGAIINALSPLCSELDYPAQPQICELPHLLHLKTPVSGQLKTSTHILSLVSALHPTPAVGGVPKNTAAAFIAEHEESERGWYAGPIGWFDGQGDGEFCVALRSGVLSGHRAFLFAGAGIVAGSEPQTEYAETQLKLRSLRASLRV